MVATHVVESAATEPPTWAQIRERYTNQWVCMVEIGWRDSIIAAISGGCTAIPQPMSVAPDVVGT